MGLSNGKATNKQMQEMVFSLKLQSKNLHRQAGKAEKDAKKEKLKIKKAVEQGNKEGARLAAENAIRQQNQHMNFLKLSSRIDAVASKLDNAVQMNQVSEKMCKITQKLGPTMNSMNTLQMAQTMGEFEGMFEDIDVRMEMMNSTIDGTTTTQIPEDQVANLMQQVADEHQLDVGDMLPTAPIGSAAGKELDEQGETDLEERLARLRSDQTQ